MARPAMERPRGSAATVTYTPLAAAPENAPSQAQDEVKVTKKESSLWARLGVTQILILCFGSIILTIAVLPLAWIWVESMAAAAGREPSSAWVSVIEANWTTRIVTICTAILRAVVTAQASVATAMFAGIILERVGSPLVDGPFYSTVRALSGSPTNLLWTPSLPLRRTGLSVLVVTLIVLEVSVTIAAQFLSTLLVADFGNGAFTQTSNVTNIRMLNYTRDPFLGPWWSMPPVAGWTFAEQSEPSITGPKYDDTGHTYRAFLPYLGATQRTSLRHFRGPVPISDQRVVCVQPTLRDLRLDALSPTFPRLSGQIAIANGTYPMLQSTESQPYLPFTCALATSMPIPNQEQGLTSLCWPDYGMEWKVLVEDPLVTPGPIAYNGSMIPNYLQASTMFMLLDVVSSAGVPNNGTEEVRLIGNNDTISSPWVIVGNGTDDPMVRVTTCMANLGVDTFTADIRSNWEGSEPTMSWNQPMRRYDTESMRTQLGAVRPRKPLNHRGVLALSPRSDWQPLFSDPVIPTSILNVSDTKPLKSRSLRASNAWTFKGALAQILIRMQNEGTMVVDPGIILSRDSPPGIYIAHESYTSLFQDTLEQTQSPAVALQALLTLFTQMVYYEKLVRLNGTERAETAFSYAALIPTQWTGFGVGMGLLFSHWVVMAIVVGLFARYTCHSLLGNHWQAVSQVYSKDTVAVLEMADQMKDQEVERWVKRKERGEELYSVALDEGERRVALTVKHSD
ncbi:hypothetical protein PENPOL_c006G06315 [Penicillium polonicum]|uniref:Uncharacterized protein n=1 Tax=Penicillium polonicum TaxID=60169 RepID=A0A1V6NLY0_PENPO|nr:hypothetical protein PENPOL_c006G06315 [Penicillium polonicum]